MLENKKQQRTNFLYLCTFIFLVFPFIKPQMFDNYVITTYLYYFLKITATLFILVLFFFRFKINQIHPFVLLVILYRLIMLIPTLLLENGDLIKYVGITIFDISFVMLIQYGMVTNKKMFLKACIFILDFWIILNSIALFIPSLHTVEIDYWNNKFYNSLLGLDNRFIYYYIVDMFARFVYSYSFNVKTLQLMDYFIYFICLFTLAYTYSTAALFAWILLFVLVIMLKMNYKFKFLNYKFILITFFLLNIFIVFFKLQNLFDFLIVDILHKDLTLSNRTFIWEKCINAINEHYILGYGYEKVEAVMANMNGANHAHNYMLMIIYRGGIVSFIIYALLLLQPNKWLKQIKYSKLYLIYSFIMAICLLLCLFDSFDYTLFYLIPFGGCYLNNYINEHKQKGVVL